jgi:AbrB family looped-hinge helix DNA binding protein
MNDIVTMTVSSKGQITLPKRARLRLGVQPGSRLVLKKADDQELVLGVAKRPKDYYGVLNGV